MRRFGGFVLLAVAMLVSACGPTSLQKAVDAANRRALDRVSSHSYMLMSWTDTPKEWLLLTDSTPTPGAQAVLHSMLMFYQQRLSVDSRVQIIESNEISDPDTSDSSQGERERKALYQEASQQVSNGKKWISNLRTTAIHPFAADYQIVGTITFRGRAVRLLATEVYTSRSQDPFALFDYAQVLVGLDQETGDLVLEYMVNLQPKSDAANQLLTVHDHSTDRDLGQLARLSPAERAEIYQAIYAEMTAMDQVLSEQARKLKPVAG